MTLLISGIQVPKRNRLEKYTSKIIFTLYTLNKYFSFETANIIKLVIREIEFVLITIQIEGLD